MVSVPLRNDSETRAPSASDSAKRSTTPELEGFGEMTRRRNSMTAVAAPQEPPSTMKALARMGTMAVGAMARQNTVALAKQNTIAAGAMARQGTLGGANLANLMRMGTVTMARMKSMAPTMGLGGAPPEPADLRKPFERGKSIMFKQEPTSDMSSSEEEVLESMIKVSNNAPKARLAFQSLRRSVSEGLLRSGDASEEARRPFEYEDCGQPE
ncbi:MAG: uncharacterized protein KVP18_001018 [Porospora cf. gigantea A]|uniref:uncharacterized protein n=1 Tax=Porospora cf. gigantea A TaxID=2853593 RepID=UPI00355AAF45|nr:MAG: hypothetical protein KVP18_001018 [Porospora cf. gigantea A]